MYVKDALVSERVAIILLNHNNLFVFFAFQLLFSSASIAYSSLNAYDLIDSCRRSLDLLMLYLGHRLLIIRNLI